MSSARERYHIAKLSLFNVRLLHRLQEEADRAPVRDLIESEATESGFDRAPLLLNQGTFLQFAYICLVWLWESVKREDLVDDLLGQLPVVTGRLGVGLPPRSHIRGEREVADWESVLRLIRNALSHGSVEITDDHFVLFDRNRRCEVAPTYLTLTWSELGRYSEACLHALTPVLWPPRQ